MIVNRFDKKLLATGRKLNRRQPQVLQLNLGKLCNLTCVHCHVNAGPARKEIITRETLDRILNWLRQNPVPTVDLTGGTPEMIPDFRYLVDSLREMEGIESILDRLNATILQENGFEWVAPFLADREVTLIASMPCYSPENVNEQRGNGVFESSITALQKLNRLGYGTHPKLQLHFVYNPNGAFLPPSQNELESDYKREMKKHFGIIFNDLYTITNMPIARYAAYLRRQGKLQEYLDLLVDHFNPGAVEGLMCRDTISVGWQGDVYDCDFNQQLGLHAGSNGGTKLWDLDLEAWAQTPIRTGDHCFGCTAGAGSSCTGALV